MCPSNLSRTIISANSDLPELGSLRVAISDLPLFGHYGRYRVEIAIDIHSMMIFWFDRVELHKYFGLVLFDHLCALESVVVGTD